VYRRDRFDNKLDSYLRFKPLNKSPVTRKAPASQPPQRPLSEVQQLCNTNKSESLQKGSRIRSREHLLSRLERSLSSLELLGITLVPLMTAQLKASCTGVILIDSAILAIAASFATFFLVAQLIVRGPQAVTWIFWIIVSTFRSGR
jgi:hypothetical protein